MKRLTLITTLLASLWAMGASADSTEAACEIYPAGADHTDVLIPCTFSQRQGYITITRSDGVTHDLAPVGDAPGNFRDQDGQAVYRQSGLGQKGLIFRFPNESVYVYWDTAMLNPEATNTDLADTSWRLVKIASMDDTVLTPDDPEKYTLEFAADGRAAIRADCNRGSGTWTSEGLSQLTFGPIAATLAMCPPDSISDQYLKQFEWVRSYVMRDGHLFLATMADGAIIEFKPAAP